MKPELPNLWVSRAAPEIISTDHYVFAYLKRQHDTEALYVPAPRIRELIDKDFTSEKDFSTSYLDLVVGLEKLITEQP